MPSFRVTTTPQTFGSLAGRSSDTPAVVYDGVLYNSSPVEDVYYLESDMQPETFAPAMRLTPGEMHDVVLSAPPETWFWTLSGSANVLIRNWSQ